MPRNQRHHPPLPPRQASADLCGQSKQGPGRLRPVPAHDPGGAAPEPGRPARGQAHPRAQQRRRGIQPLPVFRLHGPPERLPPLRRAGPGHGHRLRLLRGLENPDEGRRRGAVRLGLRLAGLRLLPLRVGGPDRQPGLSPVQGAVPPSVRGRVGARLLSGLPKPPGGLRGRLVQPHQLALCRKPL